MRVIVTPKAIEQYEKLPKSEKAKIKRKIAILEDNPLAGKKLGGELLELRSLRAWPYRIIYCIVDHKFIKIASILHRQRAYG